MPVHNQDIAAIFDEIADLLELQQANPFRIRAYRRAAQTVRSQPRELAERVASGRALQDLPGIGDDLAAKIVEILGTGRCAALDKLKRGVPEGLEDLLHLPGLGPARVRLLRRELGITSLARLRAAIEKGRLTEVRGFGPKLQARLAEAIANPVTGKRALRATAARYAASLVAQLQRVEGVETVTVAGSFRRGSDTVGDLDLVVSSRRPAAVMKAFTGYDEVRAVLAAGDTRASVRLASGLQVDLRIVPRASYGAALHYFTGSKAHNIHVRRMGQRRKLKINEYGVFRGREQIAGETEESVFASVGLPFIPPELREDNGEIEAAAGGRLPALVERADLRGDLHVHTSATDGTATLTEMARAARAAGLQYIACTDHSRYLGAYRGLDAGRLAAQLDEIDRLNAAGGRLTILKGIEVDILEDGSLALPDDVLGRLDLVIGAVHGHFGLGRRRQADRLLRALDHPHFSILAHPAARLIGEREPIDVDLERVVRHCAQRGCFLELNAQPQRLDLDDAGCRLAAEHGVLVSIASDAHRPEDFACLEWGVTQARRGWLGAANVLNTLPLARAKELLYRTMS
ncbi:MAG: polymerase [Proteobacteria bacterium]|nr:polymerase [Pseudomonadota bacterium]